MREREREAEKGVSRSVMATILLVGITSIYTAK
jgi:FlaG/FlaF family flagellin (archaellin)